MSNNPLLSITIPTKNRYSSLKYLVNALLKFESDDFEVIIQDNSTDNSDFKAFLDSLNCLKIRYYYTNQNISVVQNCDLAIEHSKGEYVCMIGVDDGVVPSIIDFVKFMKSQNIDGAYVKFARYIWPDVILKVHNFAGKFYYPSNIIGTHKLDANLEFTKSFKSSGTTLAKMPKVYHGIISKKCLNEVKELSGSYFPGPSPDMANAVGLSFFVKNYIYCDSLRDDSIFRYSFSIVNDSFFFYNEFCKNIDTVFFDYKNDKIELIKSYYDVINSADEECYIYWNKKYGLISIYNYPWGALILFDHEEIPGFAKETFYNFIIIQEKEIQKEMPYQILKNEK
ncbi:MAG TPA: glycosyltransferase [Bacteroidales bacterium]|nr:glycosyltransferase [Bacteroidales bacterium]